MTLKDWKKAKVGWSKSLPSEEWYHKTKSYSYVHVWKTGISLKEMRKRGHEGTYIFSARIGRDGITTKKYFKTKSAAFRYALNYMRTH